MDRHRILFDSLEWQNGIYGARSKVFFGGAKQLRLLEFTSEFIEPEWCEKGHMGLVVQGELEIDFQGHLVRYPQGSGIFIPAGSITPKVLLFLVEDI